MVSTVGKKAIVTNGQRQFDEVLNNTNDSKFPFLQLSKRVLHAQLFFRYHFLCRPRKQNGILTLGGEPTPTFSESSSIAGSFKSSLNFLC